MTRTRPIDAAGEPLYNAGEAWVVLMQKAYAVFVQRYGQYGARSAGVSQPAGYEGIVAGASHQLYAVLYGPKLTQANQTSMRPNNRLPVLAKLLAFAGSSPGKTTFLTASATVDAHVDSAIAAASNLALTDEAHKKALGTFKTHLVAARNALKARGKAPATSLPAVLAVVADARQLASVLNNYTTASAKALRELCLDLAQINKDPEGDRFVYSEHSYAITNVEILIRQRSGSTVAATAGSLKDGKAVDFELSKITLRNPHRGHVPSGLEVADKDGEFVLTLTQFLRHFGTLGSGVVKTP